jgi:hypothetical protein
VHHRVLEWIPAVATAIWVAAALPAHGGQFRGPGDAQPPNPGSSGTNSSSSSSSASPGSGTRTVGPGGPPGTSSSSGPAIPGPGVASAGRGGSRGVAIEDDPARWDLWWEFRKDQYLRLRDHVRGAANDIDAMLGGARPHGLPCTPPTREEVDRNVLPALAAALADAADRDTITGCLVALAKVGRDLPGIPLSQLFRQHLVSHDQEVRETAALCFGIARTTAAADHEVLLALALDSPAGRQACGHAQVDDRTRSFACYALGLVLESSTDLAAQHRIVRGLLPLLPPLLSTGAHTPRDVAVATIAALAQVPPGTGAAAAALRATVAGALLDAYEQDVGPGEQLVQAHCPPSLAYLIGRDPALGARARERFAADLVASLRAPGEDGAPLRRSNRHLSQSCALALGWMSGPWDDARSPDAEVAQLLLRVWREHKDQQTRSFALIALGRAGGALARAALLQELERANRSVDRPWVMLALANLVAERAEQSRREGVEPAQDAAVASALLATLDDVKNPAALGATAIAAGIAHEGGAGDALLRLLDRYPSRDEFTGQLAIGLSLLGVDAARDRLRDLLPRTVRRPDLLVQVAMALGRLGDTSAVQLLLEMMRDSEGGLARLSALAMAVGQIGDRRALEPLLAMLQNRDLTPLTRAFAAVALGNVCDPRPLPWNAHYAFTLNYRAAVDTLTDGSAGILDII